MEAQHAGVTPPATESTNLLRAIGDKNWTGVQVAVDEITSCEFFQMICLSTH